MFTLDRRQFGLLTGAAISGRALAASAQPRQPIKIGGLATLEGPSQNSARTASAAWKSPSTSSTTKWTA